MYDSKTDRADFSGPDFGTATPWHLRSKLNGRRGRELKRQTNRTLRKVNLPSGQPLEFYYDCEVTTDPRAGRFGKWVYCYCCCTVLC